MDENRVRVPQDDRLGASQNGANTLIEPAADNIGPVYEAVGQDATDSTRTNYESVDYAVEPGNIEARSGNFLFTVGNPSCGKLALKYARSDGYSLRTTSHLVATNRISSRLSLTLMSLSR